MRNALTKSFVMDSMKAAICVLIIRDKMADLKARIFILLLAATVAALLLCDVGFVSYCLSEILRLGAVLLFCSAIHCVDWRYIRLVTDGQTLDDEDQLAINFSDREAEVICETERFRERVRSGTGWRSIRACVVKTEVGKMPKKKFDVMPILEEEIKSLNWRKGVAVSSIWADLEDARPSMKRRSSERANGVIRECISQEDLQLTVIEDGALQPRQDIEECGFVERVVCSDFSDKANEKPKLQVAQARSVIGPVNAGGDNLQMPQGVPIKYQPFDCRPKIKYYKPEAGDGVQQRSNDKRAKAAKKKALRRSVKYQQGVLACRSASAVVLYVNKGRQDDVAMALASISQTACTDNQSDLVDGDRRPGEGESQHATNITELVNQTQIIGQDRKTKPSTTIRRLRNHVKKIFEALVRPPILANRRRRR